MTQLETFRNQKDLFFETDHQSPLTSEQKDTFQGLNYFPENNELTFELKIEEFDIQESIKMQTSTGDVQDYVKAGKINFKVEKEMAELTVYQSHHGYFIPFVDKNAGETTYGAGRYLDPPLLENGKLEIDFNQAYNPYCAYNENYSCPLPPAENRLSMNIEAGEKNFK